MRGENASQPMCLRLHRSCVRLLVLFNSDLSTPRMRLSFLGLFAWTISAWASRIACEVFTSTADVEELSFAGADIKNLVNVYIEKEVTRLEKLKRFADNLHVLRGSDGAQLRNPIDAFWTIRLVAQTWQTIKKMMREIELSAKDFLKREHLYGFPTDEDVQGAAVALFRLQDTYELAATDMARGDLRGAKTKIELRADDCFEIGRIAFDMNDYYHTIPWMFESLERFKYEDEQSPVLLKLEALLDHLALAMFAQGNVRKALGLTKLLEKQYPGHPNAVENIDFYENLLDESDEEWNEENNVWPPTVNERPYVSADRKLFERLCRGEIAKSPKTLSKLYCAYKRDTSFLALAPLKYEVVNVRPTLLLFKGVISEAEIAAVKALAQPKLERAGVGIGLNGGPSSKRISKSAWLESQDDLVVAQINARIGDMTNYDMSTSEDLQIANYGIGGHYDPHFDADEVLEFDEFDEDHFDRSVGNRIATVLFYLSQPEVGGATVFIDAQVAVLPSKHDALFWNNLLPNGLLDRATRHAGCPVLSGTKWISNKWIHERGQEFIRPCSLTPTQYD